MRRSLAASVSIALLLAPTIVGAARFPDVPGDHPYNSPVEALAIEGVVTGNPDGNFYPARPVNRAEFLTMLYRAAKKTAAGASVACFSDVNVTAWYANVVCDAAAHGYVGGYPNGTFKPEQTVNRVEALKMIYKVFGLAVLTGADATSAAKQFTDVEASAWYMVYLSSSYRNGLLPIAGYSGNKFYPTNPLLRGEAAAYVWSAMNISGEFETTDSSSSSSATFTSSIPSEYSDYNTSSSSRSNTRRSSSKSSAKPTSSTTAVSIPFTKSGDVDGLKTLAYTFTLSAASSLQIDVAVVNAQTSGVTCRLYLLGTNGLSEEYYLGYVDEHSCHLRVAAPKGDYQLEVRPVDSTADYSVTAATVKGDGNDGFSQAVLLQPKKPKVGQLPVGDIADWYTFTVTTPGKHTVQTFGSTLSCLIFPLSDVNLFGDTTPLCGAEYDYPMGTYIVRVQRADNIDKSLDYSVQLD